MTKLLTCPECGSEQVTTEHHQMFYVNTGDHYCHSMKTHDDNSPATCLDCDWKGVRSDLKDHRVVCAALAQEQGGRDDA